MVADFCADLWGRGSPVCNPVARRSKTWRWRARGSAGHQDTPRGRSARPGPPWRRLAAKRKAPGGAGPIGDGVGAATFAKVGSLRRAFRPLQG